MHVAHDGVLQEALCWECNNTKLGAKRIIRQLAAKSTEGFLLIEGGMTPSVCDNGKHVDRPGKTGRLEGRRETAETMERPAVVAGAVCGEWF